MESFLVAVSPLPNYYLVIFLSECSVNALHRNTAKRSGWMAHHCHQKVSYHEGTSIHVTTPFQIPCMSSGSVAIGKRKKGGRGRGNLSSHLSLSDDKKAVASIPPPLHCHSTPLHSTPLVSGDEGTAAKTSRMHACMCANRSRHHYYKAD